MSHAIVFHIINQFLPFGKSFTQRNNMLKLLLIIVLLTVVVITHTAVIDWKENTTVSSFICIDSKDTLVIHPGVTVTFTNASLNSYIEVNGQLQILGTQEQPVFVAAIHQSFIFMNDSSASVSYTTFTQKVSNKNNYLLMSLASNVVQLNNVFFNKVEYCMLAVSTKSLIISSSVFTNTTSAIDATDSSIRFINNDVNRNDNFVDVTIGGATNLTSVISSLDGSVQIFDNRINGQVKLEGCARIIVSNNTIQYAANGLLIVTRSCVSNQITIEDNTISAEYNSISIQANGVQLIQINNNELYSLNDGLAVQLSAYYGDFTFIIEITKNIAHAGFQVVSPDNYQILLTNNTFDSIDYPVVVSTNGGIGVTENIFRNFKTSIDLLESCPNSLIVDSNVFSNGETVLDQLSMNKFTFSNNIVTRCNLAFEYAFAPLLGVLTLKDNVFDSNSCLNGKGLVSYGGIVNSNLQIYISGNSFINTVTIGRSIVFVRVEPVSCKFDLTVSMNSFIGSNDLSLHVERSAQQDTTTVKVNQNIFNNSKAKQDFAADGFNENEVIDAHYNYWGTDEWNTIMERVNEPRTIRQSPFFLSGNVTDFSHGNIGNGIVPGTTPSPSHNDEPGGLLTGAQIGLIIVGVLIALVIIVTAIVGTVYIIRKRSETTKYTTLQ
jgi:hypothetical protein